MLILGLDAAGKVRSVVPSRQTTEGECLIAASRFVSPNPQTTILYKITTGEVVPAAPTVSTAIFAISVLVD